MKKISGSAMICEALKEEKVQIVFGYPGGAALNIYDEIYKQKYFKHILVRHEQAALHAADAYARMSGKVGVAIVTSGPGFTNTITGLATAYSDSIPLVLISGQVANSLIGTDAFQEIDAVGISRPCVKHNYLVTHIEELPRILKEAFYLANTGRKGPVHIDIPKDVSAVLGEWYYPKELIMKTYKPVYKGNTKQIKKFAELLKEAKKPLFYLGGGCISSNASEKIRELVKLTQIPAIETLMALGTLRNDDALNLKMAGMHGSYTANMAISECDLLIAIGARFDDRITGKTSEFAKQAKIIHIDIDPSSISKIINAHFPVVGDILQVITQLLNELKKEDFIPQTQEWLENLTHYQKLYPLSYEDSDEILKPQWIIEESAKLAPNARIITDVGQHQMWVAQFYPFNYPRQLATSGGQGAMGYSVPAALGAKLAVGEKEIVVNFVGDGSVLMNIQELITAYEYNIATIHIILNNAFLGMVRQWQSMFYQEHFSETDLTVQPDFIKIAEGFGCLGYHIHTKAEFRQAFKEALQAKKTALLNVVIDRFEDVLPMVPAGGAIYNMILPKAKEIQ
ncbi:acetolactate synthase large subunit [Campylobacter sp. MIT 21-1685]|uniref:acetolactate synthase large subunit n=1 Tax=unclassified Campylobacter TaxID=2593542 RepID=UPI00224AED59|nr:MULTISPECIES: acetolactate synthase large subunit [unclassified Campylobacter]MCX2682298.1 acetolactate synthase large subunit [Campylobacter sp. MIT 21-1684]MCX2750578.1 acetolactate synthase large subunit [Campylobacter sp. MIT 21-1682]MCX2806875.1 acetolactate synthase large subunit [Campylobacter sp. MIT 21-1685]